MKVVSLMFGLLLMAGCNNKTSKPSLGEFQPFADKLTTKWCEDNHRYGLPNEKGAHDKVRRNTEVQVARYMAVISNPESVQIGKTKGEGSYVITIHGANKRDAELWLESDGKISSIKCMGEDFYEAIGAK